MRIACVGGGPGGLFLATLIKHARTEHEVVVFERNQADDTFGFGVVFSDRTLDGIHEADPVLRHALAEHGRHWEEIEVRVKGERIRCGGNGMAAISRQTLLALLRDRARDAGADVRFGTEVELADLDGFDLVVACDGANSRIRQRFEEVFEPSVETATAKFIWLGTDYQFDGLTFVHERGPHGVFAVHGYPISDKVSTFIVETDEASWRAAGLDEFDTGRPPGASDLKSRDYLQELFGEQLDGHRLLVNNSRWGNFRTRRARRWRHGRVVLLGDAAHTAHFSVGSGTKMAMEDAIALSDAIEAHPGDLNAALAAYEATARPAVDRIQDAARPSLSWWEHFATYHDAFEPWQFAFHFMSRSITAGRLRRRAPEFVAAALEEWQVRHGAPPLRSPLRVGEHMLPGRVLAGGPPEWATPVAAPMDERDVAAVVAAIPPSHAVAVHGGTPLTRTLVSEQVRLRSGLPTILVDDGLDEDAATTAILSGRADLVAVSSAWSAI
ncbi:FAD-dependent monooxygenase [Nonomuraea sp. H19]|uniref:FAD-dependent monooxygenase n=1 Tax=Nonomuraea sp. H19 TaxID=3452206 RepID=UPI003F8A4C87